MPRRELTFQLRRDVIIEGGFDGRIEGNANVFHASILAQTYRFFSIDYRVLSAESRAKAGTEFTANHIAWRLAHKIEMNRFGYKPLLNT
jgi:hypothetical protein